jgi:hypothetical protein
MDERETFDNKGHTQIEAGLNYYLKQKWKLCVTLFCLFSFITMVRFYFKKKILFY